jgi:FkbM family methyltransferase
VPRSSNPLFEILPPALSSPLAAWKHYLFGDWDIRELRRIVPRGGFSIDVGAHHGVYTYYLSRLSKRVVAYEPNPKLARYLRRTVPRNVEVREFALSDHAGRAYLSIPLVEGVAIPGWATVVDNAGASQQTFEISLVRLDDEGFRDVDFMKVDVEGKEVALLRGGAETIRRSRPILLIEIEARHHSTPIAEVLSMIERMGYSGYFLCDRMWTPAAKLGERLAARPRLRDPNTRDYVANFLFWPEARGNPPW